MIKTPTDQLLLSVLQHSHSTWRTTHLLRVSSPSTN
jgi:hypothetical protein